MRENQEGRSSGMSVRARQLAIAKAVMAGDAATAEELAGLIGVSVMTIYRDVSILEDCGVLRRNRGRIVAVVNGLHAVDAIFRVEQGAEEKRIIARAGASLVAPGSSVLLDDSSAGVWLFRSLDRVDTLTIVTNSLLIANQAISEKVSGLVIIGGEYRPWAHSSMGAITLEALKRITTDYCFLSAPGIVAMSCVHPYEDVAEVKRAMLRAGNESVLLADHAKFTRRGIFRFADVGEFDHVIVDSGTPGPIVSELRRRSPDVIVAGDEPVTAES